jgi:hypothetical protein
MQLSRRWHRQWSWYSSQHMFIESICSYNMMNWIIFFLQKVQVGFCPHCWWRLFLFS